MEISKIKMPVEQAQKEWKTYNDLLKKRKDKYLEDLKKATFQLKKGKELLDVYVTIEKAGLDKFGKPKLAIARADWTRVWFRKQDTGRGHFAQEDTSWPAKSDGGVSFPPNTFQNWIRIRDADGKDTWQIHEGSLSAKVPIIPSYLEPEASLDNYYILWEVQDWEASVPARDDPILLKRITENLFVILGAWDVTELEQSIIRGL